jgi:hypothetical protein
MSPRTSTKVAFAFEREQVRKWETELNHIMLPSSSPSGGGEGKGKFAMFKSLGHHSSGHHHHAQAHSLTINAVASGSGPTTTEHATAGSPPHSPTLSSLPLHSLHYYAGTEDSGAFAYLPPDDRDVKALAVRTYVHEPDVDMKFCGAGEGSGDAGMSVSGIGIGGTPLSREEILAWEREVERFSSASARQAL